jgi:hypothetical protein
MVMPVDGVAHEEHCVMDREAYEEEKGCEHQPLLPTETLQDLNYFAERHLSSDA